MVTHGTLLVKLATAFVAVHNGHEKDTAFLAVQCEVFAADRFAVVLAATRRAMENAVSFVELMAEWINGILWNMWDMWDMSLAFVNEILMS